MEAFWKRLWSQSSLQAGSVLTFDLQHFRAARAAHGHWELVIDEHRRQQHTRS
jgi:hypothetical protein